MDSMISSVLYNEFNNVASPIINDYCKDPYSIKKIVDCLSACKRLDNVINMYIQTLNTVKQKYDEKDPTIMPLIKDDYDSVE